MSAIRFAFEFMIAVFGMTGSALADDRAAAAVALFRSFCITAPPTFADIDRRATAAGYTVLVDRDIPVPDGPGHTFKQKNWLVPGPGGPIMLTSADVTNGPLHLVGCGFAVTDVDGMAVARLLTEDQALGEPVKPAYPLASGGRGVTWVAHVDSTIAPADSQVMLAFDVPGLQGSVVNFLYKTHH